MENKNLRRLLSSIDSKSNTSCYKSIRQKYKMDLEASLDAFHKNEEPVQPADIPYDFATITSYFDSSKQQLKELYERISIATQPKTPLSTLLSMSGFWPRSTVVDLLGLLASTHHIPIDEQWTDCLIRLGRAVTLCQRARRLVLAAEAGQVSKFFSEIHHSGSTEWDPKELPEWLLFEIENDLLIRPIQARVAREMLAPSCSSNMLTQLNMGVSRLSFSLTLIITDDPQLGGQIFRHCAHCSQCYGKRKTALKSACPQIPDNTNVGYSCALSGRSCRSPDFLHAVLEKKQS